MRILATAYAVNPYKGSEDGTGWNLINQIAKNNYVIAITRKNNKPAIEKYIAQNPDPIYKNIEFAYFDLPYWARFWKRGGRGAMLYFYLWRLFIPLFIFAKRFKFDVAHALNFHNDWTPSFLWIFGKPFVWGPVGHHPKIPAKYALHFFGKLAYLKNQVNWLLKKCFWYLDPFLKITKLKADTVIAINSSVTQELNLNPQKVEIMPAVACKNNTASVEVEKDTRFTVLNIGRFEPIKGTDIALRAFADFYYTLKSEERNKVVFKIIGKGKYKAQLQQLANNLQIDKAIEFIEWMPREDLNKLYKISNVFFFSSHEGAGMVIPEALSYGIPVICFNNCGPGELTDEGCAIKINYTNYKDNITDFSKALKSIYDDPELQQQMATNARNYYLDHLNWTVKATQLNSIYTKIVNHGKGNHLVYTPAKRLQWQSFSTPPNH